MRMDMKREARRIVVTMLGVEGRMTEKAIFAALNTTDATHEALCELEDDGYITRKDGVVSLTPEGVAAGVRPMFRVIGSQRLS
jgi:Mn-dependent DtxR family transcriptional regulator